MLNVIDTVSKKKQVEVKKNLNVMMYAKSREEATPCFSIVVNCS